MLRPFLRWAGGKQRLVKDILNYIPQEFRAGTYFEPFLGGGSVFWALKPSKAHLSDLNAHLIQCYKKIKKNPKLFLSLARAHKKASSKEYYYKIRDEYNANISKNTMAQAARFYYLNRSSFNGIYRVNQKGHYNVPYDAEKNISIPKLKELKEYSACLDNAILTAGSFRDIIPEVCAGDFVYLDPPYPPLNDTAYFSHYTKDRFDKDDQKEVAEFAGKLADKGANVLISNADTAKIRELYSDSKWKLEELSVTRVISCKAKRTKVKELLIFNYTPESPKTE